MHTTNYYNTFITVADDCPAATGMVPSPRGDEKTIAGMQFEKIQQSPYRLTSDDLLFDIYAERNELLPEEREAARIAFFSKGQACLRASPLCKRYGWGIHHDHEGRIAIYARGCERYEQLLTDPTIQQVKGIRSKRA
ncbi:hypothetical protein C7T94_07620 [Pedobacter yulinensis]|uniref:Uncharacterized protein n=1 Tax=Pedobacter yulinensis TaxID=2126353 RepID=A0A2T3HJG5_9SPHI|nr:DUF6157 family protein [Pedobacter yulinensis]PST82533.1 hypothetical protein C7T94_07620 [Pedobacter yulinensis]